MKKLLSLITALSIALCVAAPAFAESKITVLVNGEEVVFPDQQPVMMNDRVLVPLRAIFEALGATVSWNDANQTAISKFGNTSVMVTINSLTMVQNGKLKTLDQPAILLNGRTMVPVRAVSEGLGADVSWDDPTSTVIIKQ